MRSRGIKVYSLTFAVLAPLLFTVLAAVIRDRPAAIKDMPAPFPTHRTAYSEGGAVGSDLTMTSRDPFEGGPTKWSALPPLDLRQVDVETLWLARCIYSESNMADEMELVAWVVRNRVETSYRGQTTYRGVILDPLQFSAFNLTSAKRFYYLNLQPTSIDEGWQEALRVAHYVRHHTGEGRPLSLWTRHFYSEQSMRGRRHPYWVRGYRPVNLSGAFVIDARRFRFYEGIM